jgi:hypothetical protein
MKVNFLKNTVVMVVTALVLVMLSSVVLAANINEKKMMDTLHGLDIFGLTDELVGLTGGMLDDTDSLSGKINQVGHHLAMLDVQKDELSKQVEQNNLINNQLGKQLALNKEARGLMQQILSVEGQTGQLTAQVGSQAIAATSQVIKTTDQLAGVGSTTGEMNGSTAKLSNQLDELNQQLGLAADSFRFIGRLTTLLNQLPIPVGDTVRSVVNTAGKTVKDTGKTVKDTGKTVQDLVKNPTDVNKTVGNVGKTVTDTVNGVTDTVGKLVPGVLGGGHKKEQPQQNQGSTNSQPEQDNLGKGLLPGLKLPILGGLGN